MIYKSLIIIATQLRETTYYFARLYITSPPAAYFHDKYTVPIIIMTGHDILEHSK